MKKSILVTMLAILLATVTGCATSAKKMNRLEVGMTKQQVISILGQPESIAAQGNGVEAMRYELSAGHDWWTADMGAFQKKRDYYVRLINGRVESYGQMGDFDSTKNPTIEIKTQSTTQSTSDSKIKVDTPVDFYTELMKLDDLRKRGLLTDEEFEAAKKKLLEKK